jgi:hypothetical protein
MPKYKIPAPKLNDYTNENLVIAPDMIDEDNMHGVESQFYSGASIEDGVGGKKPIDTSFENFSQDIVDAPRSARKDVPIAGKMPDHEGVNNPAPVCTDLGQYPHRRY